MARSEYGTNRQRQERKHKEATERNAAYQALSLYDRILQQIKYRGKQFKKLAARIEKDSDGCFTMPDGECIAPDKTCIHQSREEA